MACNNIVFISCVRVAAPPPRTKDGGAQKSMRAVKLKIITLPINILCGAPPERGVERNNEPASTQILRPYCSISSMNANICCGSM